ncbi:MAG: hypothetical protein IM569_12815 [Chitinophagaceae bacterium]|jgi:hypothetical protein|nr:hypothetical protein [Chitinophagaceae bacterium]
MNSKGKYIGLNQRIPFEVLDSAIHFYLENGVVDKNYVFQRMQEFTTGTNRANKATSYVVQILSRQSKLLEQLKKENSNTLYSSLRLEDRKALCLCFISLTYPITYDLLIALSQGFKVQSQINKKFISEKVMSIYGSNRTVDIAIDALLPIIIELNTIKRDKVSIYSMGSKLVIVNKFVVELIIFTDIKLSGSKSILIDELSFKPWYGYFEISSSLVDKFNLLITKKDSAVGKGYLTLN